MRQNRVLFWRLAASSPLFLGLSLLHCTLGGLTELGAGSPDAGHPADSGTPLADTSVDAAGDAASSGESGASPDGAFFRDAADAAAVVDASPADGETGADAGDGGVHDGGSADAGDAATDANPESMADADDGAPYVPAMALPSWIDAGLPTWCSMHPGYTFCADFDESSLPAGFSADDGAFLYQTASNPSAPLNDNNILLYVPPQGSSGMFGSKLSKSFAIAATSVTLAFDIDPELLNSTTSGLLFAGIDFLGNSSAKYSVRLAYNLGAPRLEESYLGTPADIFHANFVLPLRTWSHVQVEISFASMGEGGPGTGAPTETIYVNGVRQGVAQALTPPIGFDARPTLLIGAVYGTGPTNGWAIRYDNVILDIQ